MAIFKVHRGTTARCNSYAGSWGELVVDTTVGTVVVQNGTVGGVRLARMADIMNNTVTFTPTLTSGTLIGTITVNGSTQNIYAPTPSGGGSSSGSTVSFSPAVYSGTVIGTITINGVSQDIYAPAASSSGSTVSYMPTLTSGTQIGSLVIDGTPYTIYAPASASYVAGSGLSLNGSTFSLSPSGVTAGSYGPTGNTTSGSFNVPYVTIDTYGRVTNVTNRQVTLPTATAYTAGTGVSISGNVISLSSSGVSSGSYGPSANASPSFGSSFTVPYVTVDTYGRVTNVANRQISLPPAPSVVDTSQFVDFATNYQEITGIKKFNTMLILYNPINDSSTISGTISSAVAFGPLEYDGTSYAHKWASVQGYATSTARRLTLFAYTPEPSNSDNSGEAALFLESVRSSSGYTVNLRVTANSDYTSAGSFRPQSQAIGMLLGEANNRWGMLYTNASPNVSSDRRIKEQIAAFPDEVLTAWGNVNFVQYRLTNSIAKQGADGARLHSGLIAQDIDEAFSAAGLNAADYGLFCYDKWDKVDPEYDDNGNVVNDPTDAGDLYSLRYEEALCMEAAYQRRENERLKARLAAIEEKLGL